MTDQTGVKSKIDLEGKLEFLEKTCPPTKPLIGAGGTIKQNMCNVCEKPILRGNLLGHYIMDHTRQYQALIGKIITESVSLRNGEEYITELSRRSHNELLVSIAENFEGLQTERKYWNFIDDQEVMLHRMPGDLNLHEELKVAITRHNVKEAFLPYHTLQVAFMNQKNKMKYNFKNNMTPALDMLVPQLIGNFPERKFEADYRH